MNSGKYPYKRSFNEKPLMTKSLNNTATKTDQNNSHINHGSINAKANKEPLSAHKEKLKTSFKKNPVHSMQTIMKRRCLRVFPERFIRVLKKFFNKINKLNIEKKNRKRNNNKLLKESKIYVKGSNNLMDLNNKNDPRMQVNQNYYQNMNSNNPVKLNQINNGGYFSNNQYMSDYANGINGFYNRNGELKFKKSNSNSILNNTDYNESK